MGAHRVVGGNEKQHQWPKSASSQQRPARSWPAGSASQDGLIAEAEHREICLGSDPSDKKDSGPKSPVCRRADSE